MAEPIPAPGSPALRDESLPAPHSGPALARTMGLFSLVVYGVGDMVGSGVYGTIGEAAGKMGNAVWLAFLTSMVAALLTGLSYASLASRYPRAGGAAYVTQRAFGLAPLSYIVGLAVTASGLTSMATASNVFARNLQGLFGGPPVWVLILAFLAFLAVLNFWGLRESMWMNLLCTAAEVGGLVFIIAVGARFWGGVDYLEMPPAGRGSTWAGAALVLNGAVLTFFSFVGFEDMFNVAEECKQPHRTLPWAIVISLGVVTLLYIGVSVTAVSVVPYQDLPNTKIGPPLVQITNKAAPWLSPLVFTAVTLFAVANTALINYIMGSRLLYGMARQGLVPRALGAVHAGRRTPHVAIVTLFVVVVALALSGGPDAIRQLASATALLLLTCFSLVNAALIVLKRRPGEAKGSFEVPVVVPALGVAVCAGLIVARVMDAETAADRRAPLIAGGLLAGIALLYLVMRPKVVTAEAEDPAGAGGDPGAGTAG